MDSSLNLMSNEEVEGLLVRVLLATYAMLTSEGAGWPKPAKLCTGHLIRSF
jgi:hypothetical protein